MMKKSYTPIVGPNMRIFIWLSIFIHTSGHSEILKQIKWREISSQAKIKVFEPVDYRHPSGLVPIKFKTTLSHPIERVIAVLADEKRKIQWVPKAKQIKILKKNSPRDFIVYYRYSAPWPFQDRDFLIRNIVTTQKNAMFVELESVDNNSFAIPDDAVRGKTYEGYTKIKILNTNETSLEMGLLTDFGGFIPKWIINLVQKKWPYRFMQNLHRQLAKDDIEIPEHLKNLRLMLK